MFPLTNGKSTQLGAYFIGLLLAATTLSSPLLATGYFWHTPYHDQDMGGSMLNALHHGDIITLKDVGEHFEIRLVEKGEGSQPNEFKVVGFERQDLIIQDLAETKILYIPFAAIKFIEVPAKQR